MAVDFQHFKINPAGLSMTSVQYRSIFMQDYNCERGYVCKSLGDNTPRENDARFLTYPSEETDNTSESTENSDAFLPEELKRLEPNKSVHSYTTDEELKAVFTELKDCVLSTSASEATLDKAVSEESVGSVEKPQKKWDTIAWREYYETNKAKSNSVEETAETTSGTKKDGRVVFKNVKMVFNQKCLKRLKRKRQVDAQADKSDVLDTSNSEKPQSLPPCSMKKRKCAKYAYEDYETWLFSNCKKEDVTKYRENLHLKRLFAPALVSKRKTDRLNHTEVYEATKPDQFKKLSFKFRPHAKFPEFGEGKYATTAVSKNYTFTPTEQMSINRANYVLDQRLKQMKTRKSVLTKAAEKFKPIKIEQSSSYINRMKEYKRINDENKKIAKKINPVNIKTTYNLGPKKSVNSVNKSSAVSTISGVSSTSRFSSNMYTKAYDIRTVKQLAHSKNQYGPNTSPSKKHKRPEWDVGHIDYKKTEIKPIKYKSIRKLPVSVSNTNSSVLTKPSKSCDNRITRSKPAIKDKPLTAPQLRSKTITDNRVSQETKSNLQKPGCVKNTTRSKGRSRLRQPTDYKTSHLQSNGCSFPRHPQAASQDISNKSRIPVRRLDKRPMLDLNDTKFQVFQNWNNELFGTPKNEKNFGTNRSGRGKEIGSGDASKELERNKRISDNLNKTPRADYHLEIEPLNFGSEQSYEETSYLSGNDETLSQTSTVHMEDWSDTCSPQLMSPRGHLIEDCVTSPSPFNLQQRPSFNLTLETISERTESDSEHSLHSDKIYQMLLQERIDALKTPVVQVEKVNSEEPLAWEEMSEELVESEDMSEEFVKAEEMSKENMVESEEMSEELIELEEMLKEISESEKTSEEQEESDQMSEEQDESEEMSKEMLESEEIVESEETSKEQKELIESEEMSEELIESEEMSKELAESDEIFETSMDSFSNHLENYSKDQLTFLQNINGQEPFKASKEPFSFEVNDQKSSITSKLQQTLQSKLAKTESPVNIFKMVDREETKKPKKNKRILK